MDINHKTGAITLPESELIHLMTAPYHLQVQYGIEQLTQIAQNYYSYMCQAYNPDKRDYPLLRLVLANIQKEWYASILSHLREVIAQSGIQLDAITHVYDLGCGTSLWWEMFIQICPNLEMVTCIDKDQHMTDTMHPNMGRIQILIDDALHDDIICQSGSHVVYFMSELLHCKEENMQILVHRKLEQSNVIVNELATNDFVDARLRMTGGKLLEPGDIEDVCSTTLAWSVVRYVTFFNYYLMARSI